MFNQIYNFIATHPFVSPFSGATWFILLLLTFCVWMFLRASKDPHSPIRWEDLLIDTITLRTSPYKLGYLIGVIVGTWIMITLADRDKLTFDLFGMYLAFLLGGTGFNTFITNKFGNGGVTPPPVVAPTSPPGGTPPAPVPPPTPSATVTATVTLPPESDSMPFPKRVCPPKTPTKS